MQILTNCIAGLVALRATINEELLVHKEKEHEILVHLLSGAGLNSRRLRLVAARGATGQAPLEALKDKRR